MKVNPAPSPDNKRGSQRRMSLFRSEIPAQSSIPFCGQSTVNLNESAFSDGAISEEINEVEERLNPKIPRKIIRLSSPFRTRWDVLTMLLALYNGITIPVIVAFRPEDDLGFLIVNLLIDLVFLCDIVLNFFTSYFNGNKDEVFDHRKIIFHYLKTSFVIDFIASFPIDNFVVMFDNSNSTAYYFLLSDLLKLLRIFRISRILKFVRARDVVKSGMRIIQMTIYLVMYIHLTGCLWYILVKHQDNWVPVPDFLTGTTDFYDVSIWRQYIVIFYHAIWMLLGNEMGPRDTLEAAVASASYLVGAIITAFLFGEILVLSSNLSRRENEFQDILDGAITTMHHMKLPKDLKSKILDYILSTQGALNSQSEYETFKNYISPSLQQEVSATVYDPIISKNPILHTDIKLTELITQRLKNKFTKPEERITISGTESDSLYFLVNGECLVTVQDKNQTFVNVCILYPGCHFGEVGLLYNTLRTATVSSLGYCTVAELTKKDYQTITTQFPHIVSKLREGTSIYRDPWREHLTEILKQSYIFELLPENVFRELVYFMEVIKVEKSQYLFKPGDVADKMYIVADGELELSFTINEKHIHLLKKSENMMGIEKTPRLMRKISTLDDYKNYKFPITQFERLKPRAEIVPLMSRKGLAGCMFYDETPHDGLQPIGDFPQEIVMEELKSGTLISGVYALIGDVHHLQCKALKSSTIYALSVNKLAKLSKDYPELKKEMSRLKKNFKPDLRGKGQMSTQPDAMNIRIVNSNVKLHIQLLWKRVIIRVILAMRDQRRKGNSQLAEMASKLKAIIACEEAGNFDLAEKVVKDEIPPHYITEDGTLDPALEKSENKSILPKTHPIQKVFVDIFKTIIKPGSDFVHNYNNIEKMVANQNQKIAQFGESIEDLNYKLIEAFELITKQKYSANVPQLKRYKTPVKLKEALKLDIQRVKLVSEERKRLREERKANQAGHHLPPISNATALNHNKK